MVTATQYSATVTRYEAICGASYGVVALPDLLGVGTGFGAVGYDILTISPSRFASGYVFEAYHLGSQQRYYINIGNFRVISVGASGFQRFQLALATSSAAGFGHPVFIECKMISRYDVGFSPVAAPAAPSVSTMAPDDVEVKLISVPVSPECDCGGHKCGYADYAVGHSHWCAVAPSRKS